MKKHAVVLTALVVALLPAPSLAGAPATFSGKVVAVADGDTITVLQGKTKVKVRLHGIDCPEKAQPFGKRAKQFTAKLVLGKVVRVVPVAKDGHGRLVARVYYPRQLVIGSGLPLSPHHATTVFRSLQEELVKAGLAWWYRRYAPKDKKLAQLASAAIKAKRGLWADPHPIAPWKWRRRKRTAGGKLGLLGLLRLPASTSTHLRALKTSASLSRKTARRIILRRSRHYRACFVKWFRLRKGLQDTLTIKLNLGAKRSRGVPKVIRHLFGNPKVGRCVANSMKLLLFPPQPTPSSLIAVFEFRAGRDVVDTMTDAESQDPLARLIGDPIDGPKGSTGSCYEQCLGRRLMQSISRVAIDAQCRRHCAKPHQVGKPGRLRCNAKSKVCHRPSCGHYRCKKCTARFTSQAEAMRAGYRLHKRCTSRAGTK